MTSNPQKNTDIAIIGAGPIGLFGVFACGMLGLKSCVFDALPEVGGQCTALYPQKPIYDIPGFPSVLAGDLIRHLSMQAAPFSPEYLLGAPVTSITKDETGSFIVQTKTEAICARTVLIAGGGGAFSPTRPPLDNLAEFEGKSVFYAVQDADKFKGKKVVIAGGGDSAIDWAILLVDSTEKIYLVHRRDHFRAAENSVQKLASHIDSGRIEKVTPYQLSGISGDNRFLRTVHVTDMDGRSRDIPADYLLCFYGLSSHLGIFAELGLDIEHNHILVNPTTGETNQPGIYAAGDIATYPHKNKLILTGFAEITQAAHSIYTFLNPRNPLPHVHSTTKGIPEKRKE